MSNTSGNTLMVFNCNKFDFSTCNPTGAIFSTMVPVLTGDFPAVENQANTIRFDFEAVTDKVLSTNVPGSSLWELGVFFNKQPDGSGPRLREESNILDPYHEDIDLLDDANLEFDNLDFQGDLTGLLCSDVPFLCFELKKNDAASLDYEFGTNPEQNPFVECLDFSEYCQGKESTFVNFHKQLKMKNRRHSITRLKQGCHP